MFDAISVSKYNTYIKQIFDAEELLHNIKIIGEVFGVSFSRQVLYFSLKDENATLSCVCFYPEFSDKIKEGDLVTVTGSPNYYVKGGKLNFNVVNIEHAGQGALYQQFVEMKDKLEKEGLFDQAHKIPLPKDIKRIGVITSKEGAVIHDIINVATRRNPNIDIVLFPSKVQGVGAEDEIARAIEKFDNYENIDVIVVARGGGSLEDLWAYNTEKVARAIYNCQKPIVSSVGHETDFTIADFVADLRAPTPSAAAELLTFNVFDKRNELLGMISKFELFVSSYYKNNLDKIGLLYSNIENNFSNILTQNKFNLEKDVMSFKKAIENNLNDEYYKLGLIENSIKKLSPMEILKRGYAKIEQDGKSIDKTSDVMLSSDLEINLFDGKIIASPKSVEDRKWNTKKH